MSQREDPIDNPAFIEWAKEMFTPAQAPEKRKRMIYVGTEEGRQDLISQGLPEDCIVLLTPQIADELSEVFPRFMLPKPFDK